jgi:hypothetical protein
VNSGPTQRRFVRKLAAIVLATAFVGSLAACSDLPAEVQGCTPPATSGAASDAVQSTSKFGSPTATVPTPTNSTKAETTIVKSGSGLKLGPNDVAFVQASLYSGSSGKLLESTGTDGQFTSIGAEFNVGSKSNPVGRYLSCERVGSRSVTVMPSKTFLGTAAAVKSAGLGAKSSVVLVSDITYGYRGRAVGILQDPQSGFPSLVTSGDGTPGLTFDLQTAPKTLKWEVTRRGSGAKVKAGQELLLQVEGVEWTNPAATSTFDSTWTTHAPRIYKLTALAPTSDGSSGEAVYSLDAGSVKALTGQTVGSQLIVVVPPKYGYPSGKAPSAYPSGTLVFVYDILGVLPS